MATAADATSDMLKVTLDNYRKKLVDNVFDKHVLSWYLKDQQSTRMLDGGDKIVEHLMAYENDDTTSYAEWAQVDITPQKVFEVAKYDWRMLLSTIAISGLEEVKNSGEAALLHLLKSRVKQAEKSLQKSVNDQLWGVQGSPKATDVDSVLSLIDGSTTVGGLAPGTHTWWKSPVKNVINTANYETQYEADLRTLYNDSSDGTDVVKALIGSQDAFELYESLLTGQVRYEDTRAAGLGFTNLAFKGVPFYWDKACPVGTVIGINPEYLTLVGSKKRWFKQSPFTENPIDSAHATSGAATFVDARYSVISTYMNVTTNDRSRHFKLTGINQVTP